jgi:hypothetical protein
MRSARTNSALSAAPRSARTRSVFSVVRERRLNSRKRDPRFPKRMVRRVLALVGHRILGTSAVKLQPCRPRRGTNVSFESDSRIGVARGASSVGLRSTPGLAAGSPARYTWRGSLVTAALVAGVVAATVDIGAACFINRRSIPFILHAIAGGLLAERSFAGGNATALLGLVLQEFMGILIAAIYMLGSVLLPALRQRWLVFGCLYGAVIFVVMNYIVVPLSAWHRMPHFGGSKFLADVCAMQLFGLIIAWFAHRAALKEIPQQL